jgi:hypothetical protein
MLLENIQLVHGLLILPGRFHALRCPFGEKRMLPLKMQFSKDKPNCKKKVQIFQLFAVKQRSL